MSDSLPEPFSALPSKTEFAWLGLVACFMVAIVVPLFALYNLYTDIRDGVRSLR